MKKVVITTIWSLAVMVLSLIPISVHSNPIFVDSNFIRDGNVAPSNTTSTDILRERLKIDFIGDSYPVVKTTAEYIICNKQDKIEDLNIAFPIYHRHRERDDEMTYSFSVSLDGAVTQCVKSTFSLNENRLQSIRSLWLGEDCFLDSIKRCEIPRIQPKGYDYSALSGTGEGYIDIYNFHITMPARSTRVLRIFYKHHVSFIYALGKEYNKYISGFSDNGLRIYQYSYILASAKYWREFPGVEIFITIPSTLILYSKPALKRVALDEDKATYKSWITREHIENLHIAFHRALN